MRKTSVLFLMLMISVITVGQDLAGRVVDGSTGMTLPGATVILNPGNTGAATDRTGRFSFSGLDQGQYELTVSYLGYKTHTRKVNISKGAGQRITVELPPAVIDADEIVITGTKTERKLEEVPMRLEFAGARLFAETPSADMTGYLKNMAGVDVYSPGGFISHKNNITMRGMSGANHGRVLVLVDGIPINKSDGGSVNWNLVQPEQLQKVEITKGPGSSLYGGNALGGVINMITKMPAKKFQGYVKTEYGSLNTYGGRFNIAGDNSLDSDKGFYYSVNAYYRQSDGYINQALEDEDRNYLREADTASSIIKNDMEEYGADLRAGYRISENSRIGLMLSYYDDKRGTGYKYYTPEGSRADHDTYSARLIYEAMLGKVSFNSSLFYRQEDYYKLNDSDRDSKYYSVESARRDMGLLVNASMPLGDNSTLTAGFDLKQGSVDAVDIYQMVPDRVFNRGKMNNYAVFIQDEVRALDNRLIIIGGLRFDNARYYDGAYYIEDATSATDILSDLEDRNQAENSWSAISPRMSGQYKFSENVRAYAVYSHGFRPSVLDDLCRSGFVRGGFKEANPLLEPENLDSYELGADIHAGGLSVSPSLYYSRGNDFMYYVSTGDSLSMFGRMRPVRRVENIGEVEIKGAELKASYEFERGLSLFANYSYTESVITEFNPEYSRQGEDLTGKYLSYVPKHNASAGISWRNPLVNVSVMMNHKGEHYYDDINTVTIDPFTSFDMRLWKTVGQFSFKLDVQNITDNVTLVDYGYLNYGRFMRMEITYLF